MTHIINEFTAPVNDFPQDGPQPDPFGGYQVIINGEAVAWSDDPQSAQQSYHELASAPIPVFFNDELALWLEI